MIIIWFKSFVKGLITMKMILWKFRKRLENLHVLHDKLSGFQNVYKIKLRSSGYRLGYDVMDEKVIALVLSIGKREGGIAYKEAKNRIE